MNNNKNILLETIDYFRVRKKYFLLPIVILLFLTSLVHAYNFSTNLNQYYSFDTNLTDDSDNSRDITTVLGSTGRTTGTVKLGAGALDCNGGSAKTTLTVGITGASARCTATWFNVDTIQTGFLGGWGSNNNYKNWDMLSLVGSTDYFITTRIEDWATGIDINETGWHQAIWCLNSSKEAKLYVDGVLVSETSSTFINTNTDDSPLTLCARNAVAGNADLKVDEYAIWARILDDDDCTVGNTCGGEIELLYNDGTGCNIVENPSGCGAAPVSNLSLSNWNVTANVFSGENTSIWNTNDTIINITDSSLSITLTLSDAGNCTGVLNSQQNYTTALANDSNYLFATTDTTDQAYTFYDSFGAGNNYAYVSCYDGTNYVNSQILNFTYWDTPNVTINTPLNYSTVYTQQVDFNFTPIFYQGLQNCSLYGNFSGSWDLNQTNTSSITNNTNNFFYLNFTGTSFYEWNVECCNEKFCDFATANYTFNYSDEAPVWLYNISNTTQVEDFGTITYLTNLSSYVNDPENDTVYFSIQSENSSEVNCTIFDDYSLNLTSYTNWFGNASCTLGVNDSRGNWGENKTFYIEVTPVQDAPYFLQNLTNQSVNSSSLFTYDINCSNRWGENDTITYYSNNSILANINSSTGLINNTVYENATGNNSILLTCGNGLNTSQSFILEVNDTRPPRITTILPINNSRVLGPTVEIKYNVSDYSSISNCSLLINGTINSTDTSVTKDTTQFFYPLLSLGITYNYGVECYDSYNNYNITSNKTFTINTPPPQVNLSSPANNSYVGGAVTQLSWDALNDTDGDDITYYVYYQFNDSTPSIYTSTTDTNVLVSIPDDGDYYWYIKAYDTYEFGIKSDTWKFTKAGNPPVITKIEPSIELTKNDYVFFNISVVDPNLNTTETKVYFDGSWIDMDYDYSVSTTYYFSKNITSISDGNKSYYFLAKNVPKVQGISDTYYIEIDTTSPTISYEIPTPTNNTFWNISTNGSTVTINFTITESNKKEWNFSVSENNMLNFELKYNSNDTTEEENYYWNVTENSIYYYEVCAKDSVNNTGCSEIRKLTIYGENPVSYNNISNITMYTGINYTKFIDMDEYFYDPESGNISYNCTTNVTAVGCSFDSDNNLTITTNSTFTGSSSMYITATDTVGQTANSNIFTVSIVNPTPLYSSLTETSDPIELESIQTLKSNWYTLANDSSLYQQSLQIDNVSLILNFTDLLTTVYPNNVSSLWSYEINTTTFGNGTVYYRWNASNTGGYTNNSMSWQSFEISQFQTDVTLKINNVENNFTFFSDTEVSINASIDCAYCTNKTICLYNYSNILNCSDSPVTYNFNLSGMSVGDNASIWANYTGNYNYSDASQQYYIFKITNSPPIWTTVPTINITRGLNRTLNLSLYVTDPEGDPITFTIESENVSEVNCGISGEFLTMRPYLDWWSEFALSNCIVNAEDDQSGLSYNKTIYMNVSEEGYRIIGNHLTGGSLLWNVSTLDDQTDVSFQCWAYDGYDYQTVGYVEPKNATIN